MAEYACPNCGSTEFFRLESIIVNSQGKAVHTEDTESYKCGHCAARVRVKPDEVPEISNVPPKAAGTRVISSVSADSRGITDRR